MSTWTAFAIVTAAVLVIWVILRVRDYLRAEEAKGEEVDLTNAWDIDEIYDDAAFFKLIFNNVPDGSVLAIEDSLDPDAFTDLEKYRTTDGIQVQKGIIWPKTPIHKFRLSRQGKRDILRLIKKFGHGFEWIHAHVYRGHTFYLSAYDNLEMVFVSKRISRRVLERARKQGIFAGFSDAKDWIK